MDRFNDLSILLFDNNPQAVIQPSLDDYNFVLPPKCIAIFFKEIVDYYSTLSGVYELGRVKWETDEVVFYCLENNGEKICFYHSWVGAPISAAVMDLAIALGGKYFISVGGCGIIDQNSAREVYLLPYEGVRNEGTSFHYVAPSETIKPSQLLLDLICHYLEKENIKYSSVKTWTTDGFYRETAGKVDYQKNHNCSTVDMEFTGLCAVAEMRKVDFAAIFYSGDYVEDGAYDERDWQNNHEVRKDVFQIAINIFKEAKL